MVSMTFYQGYETQIQSRVKWIVHPKMKISPWFTHPQAILGVCDFLLSEFKGCIHPGSSKRYNDSE